MKAATVKQIKDELSHKNQAELVELCLRLSKFKKDNKELLTYLLFEAGDEDEYIRAIKEELEFQFESINPDSYFYMKKTIRKVLRNAKKFIRYSGNKQTETEVLIYFCNLLKELEPSIFHNTVLTNIFDRQIELIKKAISTLHEDLRYDYELEIDQLLDNE